MTSAPEICIIGRCDFDVGLGQITAAFAELLGRAYPVSVLPLEPHLRHNQNVLLPTGRRVPIFATGDALKISIFTDVVWNGVLDRNIDLIPASDLRIAYTMLDSDAIPPEWTVALNTKFNLIIVPSESMKRVYEICGVITPIDVLPLALWLEPLLRRPPVKPARRITTIGSLSALHPRKGHARLIEAFYDRFRGDPSFRLEIRSNLDFACYGAVLRDQVERLGAGNIDICRSAMSSDEKYAFLDSLDIYVSVSQGEGYGIGVREALALGKPVVYSNVGGHREIAKAPGLFEIEPEFGVPALYPEIDGRVIGFQHRVSTEALSNAIANAVNFLRSPTCAATVYDRKQVAGQTSYSALAPKYQDLISRKSLGPSTANPPAFSTKTRSLVDNVTGPHISNLRHRSRRTILAHDGGYFSVFNTYLSHLVWDLQIDAIRLIMPDWDIRRMQQRYSKPFESFCYGRPEDGNAWLSLYEPVFNLAASQLNDPEFLYGKSLPVTATFNERREPLLTYTNAARLYLTPDFYRWRRQYNAVFTRHIKLRSEYQAEIDFNANRIFDGRFVVGAHVRHASHAIEQPNGHIAGVERYIDGVRDQLRRRDIPEGSDAWAIFLATDQERIVQQFIAEFGERVSFFPDVRRTTIIEDAEYDSRPADAPHKIGYQSQHRVASNPELWTPRMAFEVIRDTSCLAKCDTLLHVTSNISTAVAYMNPEIELVYC